MKKWTTDGSSPQLLSIVGVQSTILPLNLESVNIPPASFTLDTSLYAKALLEMVDIEEHLCDMDAVAMYKGWYEDVKNAFNESAWDGKWRVRWFGKDGEAYGTNKAKYGKIYCNGQSWPVISGIATGDRAEQGMDSLNKLLNTQYGVKSSAPGYRGFEPSVGGISTYPPGAKENDGIFLHTNPWVMIAETILGRGDNAYKYNWICLPYRLSV